MQALSSDRRYTWGQWQLYRRASFRRWREGGGPLSASEPRAQLGPVRCIQPAQGEPGLRCRSSHVTFSVLSVCSLHPCSVPTDTAVLGSWGSPRWKGRLGLRRLLWPSVRVCGGPGAAPLWPVAVWRPSLTVCSCGPEGGWRGGGGSEVQRLMFPRYTLLASKEHGRSPAVTVKETRSYSGVVVCL